MSHADEFAKALADLHESKPLTDWPREFELRAREMVKKFEHSVRASGTMDRSTFVSAFSWFFVMVERGRQLMYMRQSDHRRIEFQCLDDALERRVVMFPRTRRQVSPEEAAEIFWSFLQDEDVPEAFV